MITTQQKQASDLINQFKQSIPNNSIPVYLSSLLFSIVLDINWLIITFSSLLAISIFVSLNRQFNWICFKKK